MVSAQISPSAPSTERVLQLADLQSVTQFIVQLGFHVTRNSGRKWDLREAGVTMVSMRRLPRGRCTMVSGIHWRGNRGRRCWAGSNAAITITRRGCLTLRVSVEPVVFL